jgi:uncharacterized protein (TIGR03435 family)
VLPVRVRASTRAVVRDRLGQAECVGARRADGRPPQNDRLTIVNVPGRQLVQMAFRVDVEQIEGVPSWLVNEHFDVTAKATAPFSPSNRWQDMLRTLLEERFRLRVRHAPKEVQGFALVVARADGRLGPSLRRASASCAELSARSKDPEKDDPCGVRTTAMRAF